jgi:hypothetical protein
VSGLAPPRLNSPRPRPSVASVRIGESCGRSEDRPRIETGRRDDPPSLIPIDLAGLSERIEQVAANRADPPLRVRIQTIPTASQPTKGYLLVIVPPTPSKIHMVDGRYWGGASGLATSWPVDMSGRFSSA